MVIPGPLLRSRESLGRRIRGIEASLRETRRKSLIEAQKQETVLFFLESWLGEAVNRSAKLLESFDSFSVESNYASRRMFDEHYLLTATVMSVRFAGQVVHHAKKNFREQLREFLDATADAVKVRDMREHSDDYFLGKGRKQGELVRSTDHDGICDMSSTIVSDSGYMLGNLISVETIRKECEKALAHVKFRRLDTRNWGSAAG